jgi:hypothetical protein
VSGGVWVVVAVIRSTGEEDSLRIERMKLKLRDGGAIVNTVTALTVVVRRSPAEYSRWDLAISTVANP